MRKILVLLLLFVVSTGCFYNSDLQADKVFLGAIQDQRLMATQDEMAERQKLSNAKERGLVIIEQKRVAIGQSFEGLVGPDGRPLLTWANAEMINMSFGKLAERFEMAVDELDKLLTVKYNARMLPVKVSEAYLAYCQTRRDVVSIGLTAFVEEMKTVRLGDASVDLDSLIEQIRTLGLPTSLDEIWGWLETEMAVKLAEVPGGIR